MSWSFKFARSRRGIVTILAALVLLLFFVRPGAGGLRSRITNSISNALGRQVEISSVSLRFLPQPGFDLENFVVHDDPAFGAEPVLRAQEVIAVLRLTSLFRGRLEISRLSLSDASLNLVRSDEGHWNFSSLVERAAKNPVAPTSKAKTEARPGFPYIEANNGRVNFKLGQEKKAFALMDADFSLWQDSENTWRMRLKAQPMRTNSNLSDTGTLRAEGSWQRSATLHETPVNFNFQWENAQLGQFTKLATGNDRGWRGSILLTAAVSGMPADLSVNAVASIQDFRRY
ncbi:MAG TPA: AsmA family protein, partial [Terriglobales bacterium]